MAKNNNPNAKVILFFIGHQQLALALYQRQPETKILNFWRQDIPSSESGNILDAAQQLWQEAEEQLDDLRPAAAIFLISPFWVKADGSLIENKKAILAQLARQLHLHPLGFLLADEALIRHYQQERGQSPSFISVALDNPSEVSLVHLGKIKSRLRLEISAAKQFPQQLEKALGQLDYPGMFPPNFVFWGREHGQFAELRSECEKYPWTGHRDSLFMQIPQFNFMDWQQFFAVFSGLIEERFREQGVSEQDGEAVSQTGEEEEKPPEVALPEGFSNDDLALDASPEVVQDAVSSPSPPVAVPAKRNESAVNLALLASRWRSGLGFIAGIWLAMRRWGLILPLAAGAGIILSLAAANLFILKRQVVISIAPQQLEFKKQIGKNDISFQPLSVELDEKGEVNVSGTATVGEKALGTVVVFNRTSHPLLLASGTKLEAKTGLTFFLRESVKIASKTADLNSGIDRLGKAEANVIAAKFGPEYNLSKDSLFKVDNYTQDESLARAKDDFSGGSNRQVKAVSKKDLANLKKQLSDKILARAAAAMTAKAGPNLEIISPKLASEIVEFKPQRHLGEEADALAGQLKMKISALAVNRHDLRQLALKFAKQRLANGSELDENSLQVVAKPVADGSQLEISVNAAAYPRLNLTKMRQQLKGKSIAAAQKIIHHYPRVGQVEIRNQWKILNFWPWLPLLENNITIKIKGG